MSTRNCDTDVNHIYQDKESLAGTPNGLCYGGLTKGEHLNKFNQIAGMLSRYMSPKAPTVLDVGCGYATLLEVYDRFESYTGIDLTQWIVEYARINAVSIHGENLGARNVEVHHTTLGEHHAECEQIGRKYDVVLGIGLTATLSRDSLVKTLTELKNLATDYLILGVQSRSIGRYQGSLNAYEPDEITDLLGCRLLEIQTTVSNTEILLVYKV